MIQPDVNCTHRRPVAEGQGTDPVALVTESDSRTPETTVKGQSLRAQLPAPGQRLVAYRVVPGEPAQVGAAMLSRATAGVFRDMRIVAMPESPAAGRLAGETYPVPELQDAGGEVAR